MLNLYIKTHCPYSIRVLEANAVIQAPLTILDMNVQPELKNELLEKGGKIQAPYLEDTDRGVSMYESIDIIEYLKEHYGNGEEVTVKNVGNVCPID
ncbi:MAG: glutathione S-transferase N-terminal domain-containing protein [Patescibacteria group bacterium]